MTITTGSQALVELESQMAVTYVMWVLKNKLTSSYKGNDKLLAAEPSSLQLP